MDGVDISFLSAFAHQWRSPISCWFAHIVRDVLPKVSVPRSGAWCLVTDFDEVIVHKKRVFQGPTLQTMSPANDSSAQAEILSSVLERQSAL